MSKRDSAAIALGPVEAQHVPFVRHPYNYNTNAASDASGLFCQEPSLTQQQFTESCDINFILDRFVKGGDITLNTRPPQYGDFSSMPSSYHEALNFIKDAEQSFMRLPALVRAKFGNDPGKFVDYVTNPDNADQLHELGLTEAPKSGATDAKASSSSSEAPRNTNSAVGASEEVPAKAGKSAPDKGA